MFSSLVPKVPRLPAEDAKVPLDEVPFVTGTVMEHVGEASKKAGDTRSAIEIAREEMARTEDNYAGWATCIQRKSPWAFRYTITKSGDAIGVQQIIGLTKEVFFAIAKGEKGELDITEAGVLEHTKYILITAQSPFLSVMDEMPTSKREQIEIHNIFLHAAYIVQHEDEHRPAILTFGGNPQVQQRLINLGFRQTGHKLKGTSKDLFVMQHSTDADEMGVPRNHSFNYNLLLLMLQACFYFKMQN
jgi:hypothetical protein